jgi:hypothetical protein
VDTIDRRDAEFLEVIRFANLWDWLRDHSDSTVGYGTMTRDELSGGPA